MLRNLNDEIACSEIACSDEIAWSDNSLRQKFAVTWLFRIDLIEVIYLTIFSFRLLATIREPIEHAKSN